MGLHQFDFWHCVRIALRIQQSVNQGGQCSVHVCMMPDPGRATRILSTLGWVLLPFYGSIIWSVIIAMLFVPVYRWLLPRFKRHRNVAAAL
jgi:hypothetical protein